jgi:cyclic pyranopterin phosphate synthase
MAPPHPGSVGVDARLDASRADARRGPGSAGRLTHLDRHGRARMVDIGAKAETVREAVARGEVTMSATALRAITAGAARKGDVLAVAQVAAIAAAKRTWELIPLCHQIPLTGIAVDVLPDSRRACVRIEARVGTTGRTGAEMEALVAVAAAGLTIYDMLKAVDRGMTIGRVRLVRKSGGKSGTYVRPGEAQVGSSGGASHRIVGHAGGRSRQRPESGARGNRSRTSRERP